MSLKRFGIFNATKKASALMPVPRRRASTISLKNPSTLELNVPKDKIDVAFMIDRCESVLSDLLVDINILFCYIPSLIMVRISDLFLQLHKYRQINNLPYIKRRKDL